MTNSMFSRFKQLDTTYQPNAFQPKYPKPEENCSIKSVDINKPYEILNADKTLKGYFWYYGNSVDLDFNIIGEVTNLTCDGYTPVSDILKHLSITATIYDFRLEPMIQFSTDIDAENKLIVDLERSSVLLKLDNAMSQKLIKGVYYIDLIATHPTGYNETLFSTDTCRFEVR